MEKTSLKKEEKNQNSRVIPAKGGKCSDLPPFFVDKKEWGCYNEPVTICNIYVTNKKRKKYV